MDKPLQRVLEKILFKPVMRGDASRIFDFLRAMIAVKKMDQVVKVVRALIATGKVVIVRMKERFITLPTAGGWRDLLINFYFKDDTSQHVVELQIVHSKMLTQRSELDGHAVYHVVRSASEMCDFLGNDYFVTMAKMSEEAERWDDMATCKLQTR